MSRTLAGSCAAVTSLLWLVALRYGAFQRKSQRLFQDALADTGQVAEEVSWCCLPLLFWCFLLLSRCLALRALGCARRA